MTAKVIEREPAGEGRAAVLDVARIREDFPILRRRINGKRLVYLDSSSTTQKPRSVIDAVSGFYERHNANIHRGVYTLGVESTRLFEEAREKLAAFVGAPSPSNIVFNRGTTESVNLVAHGFGRRFLREGDEILLTEMEHHSNLIPWQLCARDTGAVLRFIRIDPQEGTLVLDELEQLVTDRTKVVALTGMSNVLGTLPPLRRIVDAGHGVGAIVVVDGAQLVPHRPVDVVELDVDVLTISGHKMLGPTASGGMYAKRELLEAMDPFIAGGEMIREVYPETATWAEVPWKFEGGTMNIAEEVGLAAAIEYLQGIGMDAVEEHERALTAYAIQRLEDAGAQVFGPADVSQHGGAVSFWFRDIHPHDLATVLDQEGVAVRAGHHCAQPLMRVLGVPATTRASFHVYNDTDDVDALIDALEAARRVFGV